jgi:hypothetical protein
VKKFGLLIERNEQIVRDNIHQNFFGVKFVEFCLLIFYRIKYKFENIAKQIFCFTLKHNSTEKEEKYYM